MTPCYDNFMIVFIDGENFRQLLVGVLEKEKLVQKNEPFRIDLVGLFKEVLSCKNIKIKYYLSQIKLPKGHTPAPYIQKQVDSIRTYMRKWNINLKNPDIKIIKAGNLKVKEAKPCSKCGATNERLMEKGVDVRLAIDIFKASLNKNLKQIAVVSSDTDICPAYHEAKKRGVKINYICFEPFRNKAVSASANTTIIITSEILKKYLTLPSI